MIAIFLNIGFLLESISIFTCLRKTQKKESMAKMYKGVHNYTLNTSSFVQPF